MCMGDNSMRGAGGFHGQLGNQGQVPEKVPGASDSTRG